MSETIVGVDVGGTFTDVYVFEGDGRTRTAKAATTPDTVSGVLAALGKAVPVEEIDSLAFGSTIATNALVQRRLARAGLLTTAGFRDSLDVRRLWRRDLFGHAWNRPEAIVPRHLRLEAAGRIDWQGRAIEPLNEEQVREAARRFAEEEVEAVAICFLFSYLEPAHELRAAEILAEMLPEATLLLSSQIDPKRNEYERSSTTAIAAALAPIVDRALASVERELTEAGLRHAPRVMKSNGGVMSIRAARERPVELVKSGPAGGASAGAYLAERLGEPNLILIDIGGTTADASLIVEGKPVRADHDMLEWDIPIRVPVVDIRSVGAGGGSIARLDAAGGLRVGPQSAGAVPGPVAYGKGGTEPTVTDAAIVAGHIDPNYFLSGSVQLYPEAARDSLTEIAKGLEFSPEQAAASILHVATIEMASLVREITVDRGLDPRQFALVGFGGAGPLFAGALLEELDMKRAFVPVGASTLSAMGGAFGDVAFDYVRSEVAPISEVTSERLEAAFEAPLQRAREDAESERLSSVELTTSIDLRYAGQWHEIEVSYKPGADVNEAVERFEAEHERLWGHRRREDPVELIAVRVRALSRTAKPSLVPAEDLPVDQGKGSRQAHFFGHGSVEARVFERERLGRSWSAEGPLIVEEPQTTTVVPPGLVTSVGEHGELVIQR